MKKHFLKIVSLLLFTATAISSCSVQYREHRRVVHDRPYDHRYEEVHRY